MRKKIHTWFRAHKRTAIVTAIVGTLILYAMLPLAFVIDCILVGCRELALTVRDNPISYRTEYRRGWAVMRVAVKSWPRKGRQEPRVVSRKP